MGTVVEDTLADWSLRFQRDMYACALGPVGAKREEGEMVEGGDADGDGGRKGGRGS